MMRSHLRYYLNKHTYDTSDLKSLRNEDVFQVRINFSFDIIYRLEKYADYNKQIARHISIKVFSKSEDKAQRTGR